MPINRGEDDHGLFLSEWGVHQQLSNTLRETSLGAGHAHFERRSLFSGTPPQRECGVPAMPERWRVGFPEHTRCCGGVAGMRFALVMGTRHRG
jgi:hypothetical protein